jgi:hypothetical protein
MDQQLGWDGQSDSSTLVLKSAPHTPGIYLCAMPMIVNVSGSPTSVIQRTITCNGLAIIRADNISADALGFAGTDPVAVYSDGSSAITLVFTPLGGGVDPGARIDLYASSSLMA